MCTLWRHLANCLWNESAVETNLTSFEPKSLKTNKQQEQQQTGSNIVELRN